MYILPRREFESKEIAETDYLVKPDPNTTNASCQVYNKSAYTDSIDVTTIDAGVAFII